MRRTFLLVAIEYQYNYVTCIARQKRIHLQPSRTHTTYSISRHVTKCKMLVNGGGTQCALAMFLSPSTMSVSTYQSSYTEWLKTFILPLPASTSHLHILHLAASTRQLNILPVSASSSHMNMINSHLNILPTQQQQPSKNAAYSLNEKQPPEHSAYPCCRQCYLKTSKLRILKMPLSFVTINSHWQKIREGPLHKLEH